MTEKLWKTFPTITAGFKEVFETSGSLWQAIGQEMPDNDTENEQFICSIISGALTNAMEYEYPALPSCVLKVGKYTYFRYTTTGNLGVSFRKYNNKVLFMVWKSNPSKSHTLTRDFVEAGWQKSWRWALTIWWLETWQKMRELRTYYIHPLVHLKTWWLRLLRRKPQQPVDEDVPF